MFRNIHWSNPNETTLVIPHMTKGILEVQLEFLEHFYFCLVVLLIVIVSGVSWRSRRSTWRRIQRLEDSDEPGKQPFDHDEPFLIIIAFLSVIVECMATLLGCLRCIPHWHLHYHDSILVQSCVGGLWKHAIVVGYEKWVRVMHE